MSDLKGRGYSRLASVLSNHMAKHAAAGGPSCETGLITGGFLIPDQLQAPVPIEECLRIKGATAPGEGAKVAIVWTAGGPVIIGEIE